MSTSFPAKKNTAFTFYTSLVSQGAPAAFQGNPTLATGDVKVSKDGGAFANVTTLPTVTPASSKSVKVQLSSTERILRPGSQRPNGVSVPSAGATPAPARSRVTT